MAAPFGVKVLLNPGQIAVGLATTPTVGFGFTVIATVAVEPQPAEFPVKVYTVLIEGVTATMVLVNAPGCHV